MRHLLDSVIEEVDRLDTFDRPDDPSTWDGPSRLIRSVVEPEGLLTACRPLPGHPADSLIGFVAPDEWDVLGTMGYGWAGQLSDTRPSQQLGRRRVRMITLVHRDGTVAARVRDETGLLATEPPSEGLLLDSLQRALGLPTSPPPASTASLFAGVWLAEIVRHESSTATLAWPVVCALHPAVALLTDEPANLDPDQVARLAGQLTESISWSEARWMCISTGWLSTAVPPHLAAWMDDGMFARQVLAHWEPDLWVGEAIARLDQDAVTKIRISLGDAGGAAA